MKIAHINSEIELSIGVTKLYANDLYVLPLTLRAHIALEYSEARESALEPSYLNIQSPPHPLELLLHNPK